MRPLALAASISVLALGSFWVLTRGPLAPPPSDVVAADGTVVVVERSEAPVSVRPKSLPPPTAPRPRERAPVVRTELTAQSYAVGGGTADEVLRSLLDNGPRTDGDVFFGLTEAAIDLRYDAVAARVGCEVRDVEVVLGLTITLPEWMPPPGTDPELARDWGRFRRALAAHEDRHRQIAVDGAGALYKAVAGLHRTTCEQANEEARRRLERLEIEIAAAHRRFDVETGHGRTEGAVWPLSR